MPVLPYLQIRDYMQHIKRPSFQHKQHPCPHIAHSVLEVQGWVHGSASGESVGEVDEAVDEHDEHGERQVHDFEGDAVQDVVYNENEHGRCVEQDVHQKEIRLAMILFRVKDTPIE